MNNKNKYKIFLLSIALLICNDVLSKEAYDDSLYINRTLPNMKLDFDRKNLYRIGYDFMLGIGFEKGFFIEELNRDKFESGFSAVNFNISCDIKISSFLLSLSIIPNIASSDIKSNGNWYLKKDSGYTNIDVNYSPSMRIGISAGLYLNRYVSIFSSFYTKNFYLEEHIKEKYASTTAITTFSSSKSGFYGAFAFGVGTKINIPKTMFVIGIEYVMSGFTPEEGFEKDSRPTLRNDFINININYIIKRSGI